MKLNLIGEVNNEMCEKLYDALDQVESLKKLRDRILHIEITSEGGDPMLALAMASRIDGSTVDINITARGLVASSAVIIYAAGHRRFAAPTAYFLVHESSIHDWEGTASQMEKEAKDMQTIEFTFNKYLSSRTILAASQWDTYNKGETMFSAAEGLKIGLVDELI